MPRERVLEVGWEGPPSALEATDGGGGGSSYRGGDQTTSTSGIGGPEGRDEPPCISPGSCLGVCVDTTNQSTVEPSFKLEGYMGARGGHEKIIPTTLQRVILGRISGQNFLL